MHKSNSETVSQARGASTPPAVGAMRRFVDQLPSQLAAFLVDGLGLFELKQVTPGVAGGTGPGGERGARTLRGFGLEATQLEILFNGIHARD